MYFRLLDPTGSVDAWVRTSFTAVSGADGLLTVALLKSSSYRARFGTTGPWTEFTTGSASTYAIPEILGAFPTAGT